MSVDSAPIRERRHAYQPLERAEKRRPRAEATLVRNSVHREMSFGQQPLSVFDLASSQIAARLLTDQICEEFAELGP